MLTEERPPEDEPVSDLPGTQEEPQGTQPPEGTQPPSASRRLDIQGLRAIAVILVVAFHAGLPVEGGFIGVDVFLVISGYVITAMLLRELRSTGTIRFRRFYTRRVKRLLPALALLTTVVMILSIFFGSSFGSQQTAARTGLGATYFVANYVIYQDSIGYFSPEAETNPMLHTWTLSVEEQVYMVFPALLLGFWALGRTLLPRDRRGTRRSFRASRRSTIVMLVVVGVASFAFSYLVSYAKTPWPPALAFFSTLSRVWEFGVGAALALWAHKLRWISPAVALLLGLGGAAAIAIGAFAISGSNPYPGLAVLVPVLGAAAVIASGFRERSPVARALAVKPMAWIGDLSYSWYLWHWPLIVFAGSIWPDQRWTITVIGFASIIPAWLSTVLMENPIRHNERIRGWKVVTLAVVCLAIPTAACLGLAAGAEASWGNESVAEMQEQVTAPHAAETNQCDDGAETGSSLDDTACGFNQPTGATKLPARIPAMYLVGNSVAAMYSEAMIGASNNLGFPLTLDTTHGCFSAGEADDRDCSDNFDDTVRKLEGRRPGIVVMSSTWDLGSFGGNPDAEDPNSKYEKADFLIESLTGAIEALQAEGHHVVLILPTPRFFHQASGGYEPLPDPNLPRELAHQSLWRPSDCSAVVAESDTADCGATVSEADVERVQALTMRSLEKIAKQTGATTLNLRSRYCREGTCYTNYGDRWMFEDGVHISVAESESLVPTFTDFLREVAREHWDLTPDKDEKPDKEPKAEASPSP